MMKRDFSFKDPVPTAQQTHSASFLMLSREIIAVCSEFHRNT